MQRRLAESLFLFLLLTLIRPVPAGESGVTLERGDGAVAVADRDRIARTIYRHDFENFRDPDSGRLLPESAAIGTTGWPDFWEPIRAVGYPEYLIPTVRIEADESGFIPGSYRDVPNRALRMDFDGTRLGIRTRIPVPIDPTLAYEYSIMIRDLNFQGARIRTGIDWMRIEAAASSVLRSDIIPGVDTGQEDWPVTPYRMLVNDPPPEANAARLFFILDRDPGSIGGAYHGSVWVDNVTLRPLPKIHIEAPRQAGGGRVIPVRYAGLFDNIPDPNNPGYFRGKRYTRMVEITDVYGQPMTTDPGRQLPVEADDDGFAVEDIAFPRERFGVYYFNIRLYDADDRLATDVMRSVAVMAPERPRDGMALHSSSPTFGVRAGIIPDGILKTPGLLRRILERSGVRITKVVPWRDSYNTSGENNDYYLSLVDEIRTLRSAGINVTGVIRPPSGMFGEGTLFDAAATYPDRLAAILSEAGRHLGLFMDGWQWGEDDDPSFSLIPAGSNLENLAGTLRNFAGGMPIAASVNLGDPALPAFPDPVATVEGFMRDTVPAGQLWPAAAPLFPWLFEPFYLERGAIYPPARLSRLAPPPPMDRLEEQARLASRSNAWLSLEPYRAHAHEPNAASERVQLEDIMIRTIYATAIRPEVVFLGDLFDPERGLLRRDVMGGNTLETMARPSFLAVGTMSELLEGTEYLGQLYLLPPFEAHVFRRPGTDQSVIVIWHHDARDELRMQRVEIANGPALELVDWAGNRTPLPSSFPVHRVPSFITRLPAGRARTPLRVRIDPRLPVKAQTRRQTQMIEVVNHMSRQTPLMIRLKYAARLPEGGMENNWMVQPEELRINLAPLSPQLDPGRLRYVVSPDPNSQIQEAAPNRADASGLKIAQVNASINSSPPADILFYLPFNLRSDIDVEVERLVRVNDPNFITLQLRLRWFPPEAERRRGEIKLTPYFLRHGQMKESAPFPVSVKASPPEDRGNPNAPFEAVELRIPRRPPMRTWVGLDEMGGSNFYIADVTDFILAE
ncbi:MAG: hypothetical protein LUG50_04685 [Planctomycetaceae bacterium]|nr:hypothetical protein [Planctomycetaceae bacterium]